MNYNKHYNLLITKAKNRIKDPKIYYEKHHIKMRSEGGNDTISNIIYLSAREHFVAHWLLYRENPNSFVRALAFNMMCNVDPSLDNNRYIPSSRIIAEAREASARLKSQLYKTKCWVKKDNIQKNILKDELEIYEELGWIRGKLYTPTQETKDKIKNNRLNAPKPGLEFREKMSNIVKERYKTNPELWKKSNEAKAKISKANLNRDPLISLKISITRKKQIVMCPYCKKEGNISIMTRWHFEKCKLKNTL